MNDARGSAEGAIILAVEDDKQIARMLELTLEGEGYRVIDAPTGQRAIAEVRTRNPELILLDLGLPDIEGSHRRRSSSSPPTIWNGTRSRLSTPARTTTSPSRSRRRS